MPTKDGLQSQISLPVMSIPEFVQTGFTLEENVTGLASLTTAIS